MTSVILKHFKAKQTRESSPGTTPLHILLAQSYELTNICSRMIIRNLTHRINLEKRNFDPSPLQCWLVSFSAKLDLAGHIKLNQLIHLNHKIPSVESSRDVEPAVAEKPAPEPNIEGEVHVVETIISLRKRGRGMQLLTITKGDTHHKPAWISTKELLDNDGTIT